MKQTVISLDLEEIFTMMGESTTKLFSACSFSADTTLALCADIRTYFADHVIRPVGRVAVRMIASPYFTLEETIQILNAISDISSENLLWGFESDTMTERITVDMLFEVDPS